MSEAEVKVSVTDAMLQEQLKRLSEEGLLACLDEWFAFKPDRQMTKAEMAEKILILQRQKISDAQAANLASSEAIATESDPIVRVKFQNLDSPGAPLEFTFAGTRGFETTERNGKLTAKPARKFVLHHNEEADLPLSVVDHLNSRVVPDNKFDVDEHGFVRGVSNGFRNRFACQLILSPEQRRKLGTKG